jgi:p-aminobenzoyl-glutamate transporter AbgT
MEFFEQIFKRAKRVLRLVMMVTRRMTTPASTIVLPPLAAIIFAAVIYKPDIKIMKPVTMATTHQMTAAQPIVA